MKRSSTYRRYKCLPLLLIGVYLGIVAVARANHSDEIFPFFNWSLFSTVTNEVSISVIRFDSVNEQPLSPPRLYYDMGDTFAYAKQRDPTVWKTIEALADAIQRSDNETVLRTRKLLEDRHMAEIRSADYEIVRLTYDPVKRLQSGETKSAVVLATYRKAPP
jgi:hypothetical protein